MPVKLNGQNAGLRDHELDYVRPLAETASTLPAKRTGQGAEMLGRLDRIPTAGRSSPALRPPPSAYRPRVRCWWLSVSAAATWAPGPAWSLSRDRPFDQPGVEAYKKNVFPLLGKPGCENMREALEARLNG